MIRALDHVVIAVREVGAGVRAYATLLGRAPSWRAAPAAGAESAMFGLGNVALELIAPAGDGPRGQRLRALLDGQGEGLASLAFGVDDVERAARRLDRVGLAPEPVTGGESVDRRAGTQRRWRRTRLSVEATHGVRVFVVQPETPVPRSEATAGEATAVGGLDHVVIRTPDPERAAALYGARLGLDLRLDRTNPAWGTRLLFFRCGDLIVELAHDLATGVSARPDRLWGLSWRVPDAAAARERLAGSGLDVSELRPGRKPGTHVFTVRDGTCGVPTLILEPALP
jgi:catechol 2,3-dioxygenase-like lactoylglutathione lyase family enzyme